MLTPRLLIGNFGEWATPEAICFGAPDFARYASFLGWVARHPALASIEGTWNSTDPARARLGELGANLPAISKETDFGALFDLLDRAFPPAVDLFAPDHADDLANGLCESLLAEAMKSRHDESFGTLDIVLIWKPPSELPPALRDDYLETAQAFLVKHPEVVGGDDSAWEDEEEWGGEDEEADFMEESDDDNEGGGSGNDDDKEKEEDPESAVVGLMELDASILRHSICFPFEDIRKLYLTAHLLDCWGADAISLPTPHFIDIMGVSGVVMPYIAWILGALADSEGGMLLIPGSE